MAAEKKWACPKCGADANKHGKGGFERCAERLHGRNEACLGFICECDEDTDAGHGTSVAKPCPNAVCYHCGWGGTFPVPDRKLKDWEKKAIAAGWTPPEGWMA